MGKFFGGLSQDGFGLLQAAGRADPAALVPEVAADLALHGGAGEGVEVAAARGVEPPDGHHQTDEADLRQLLYLHGRVGVAGGEPADQAGGVNPARRISPVEASNAAATTERACTSRPTLVR